MKSNGVMNHADHHVTSSTSKNLPLQIQWRKVKEGVKYGRPYELLEGSFKYVSPTR